MSDIVERLRDDERSEWAICNEAADEIERLRAEVAGLREDALRYRWLRDLDEDPVMSLAAQYTDMHGSAISISMRIDAAIDAARAKGSAKSITPPLPPPSSAPAP